MKIFIVRNPFLCLFLLVGLGIVLPRGEIFSQERADNVVFAPFVSRLKAEVKNNLIRLSWMDSADVRGPVYIYRSKTPFDAANPYSRFRPVEVPYGVQSYIDEIEESGIWHYFLTSSDETGKRYEVFIPYTNTIDVTVSNLAGITEGFGDSRSFGSAWPPIESNIFSLTAMTEGDGVAISYRMTEGMKNTVLYRSVQPIHNVEDLLKAVIVDSGTISPYTDYPVPGIPYYYAIITEEELLSGTIGIFPGFNTTLTPVEVPAGRYRVGLGDSPRGLRSMPLPLISIDAISPGSKDHVELPARVPLSEEASRALASIRPQRQIAKKNLKSPRAFSQDLQTPGGGEESTLRSIVQGSFMKWDWEKSREELLRYLALPRSESSEARARFYLGQVYYYTRDTREALFEFLSIQSQYPEEANEWIQATLAQMI
ncbi:MAG: hypothetical protein LBD78_04365 [Spirochaetaceae bacterium]|jgi:hypothetical protein|nr:hypothetical protein [Spirochaetaceae bacterium]